MVPPSISFLFPEIVSLLACGGSNLAEPFSELRRRAAEVFPEGPGKVLGAGKPPTMRHFGNGNPMRKTKETCGLFHPQTPGKLPHALSDEALEKTVKVILRKGGRPGDLLKRRILLQMPLNEIHGLTDTSPVFLKGFLGTCKRLPFSAHRISSPRIPNIKTSQKKLETRIAHRQKTFISPKQERKTSKGKYFHV